MKQKDFRGGWEPLTTLARDSGLGVVQARELVKAGKIRQMAIPGFRRTLYSVADANRIAREIYEKVSN